MSETIKEFVENLNKQFNNVVISCEDGSFTPLGIAPYKPVDISDETYNDLQSSYNHFRFEPYKHHLSAESAEAELVGFIRGSINATLKNGESPKEYDLYWRAEPSIISEKNFESLHEVYAGFARFTIFKTMRNKT